LCDLERFSQIQSQMVLHTLNTVSYDLLKFWIKFVWKIVFTNPVRHGYTLLAVASGIEHWINPDATGLDRLVNPELESFMDPYDIDDCEADVAAGRKVCCRSSIRWITL